MIRMNIPNLLQTLESKGVFLFVDNQDLIVISNNDLSSEQIVFLRQQKEGIISYLGNTWNPHEYIVNRLKRLDIIDIDDVFKEIARHIDYYTENDTDMAKDIADFKMPYPLSVQWQRFFDDFVHQCSRLGADLYIQNDDIREKILKCASIAQIHSVLTDRDL